MQREIELDSYQIEKENLKRKLFSVKREDKINKRIDRKNKIGSILARKLLIINIVFLILEIYITIWNTFIIIAWGIHPLIYLTNLVILFFWILTRKLVTQSHIKVLTKLRNSNEKMKDQKDLEALNKFKPLTEISESKIIKLAEFQAYMLKIESNPEFLVKDSLELRSNLNNGKPVIIKGNPFKNFWFWLNIIITLMGAISGWFNPLISLGVAIFIFILVKKTVLILHLDGFLIRTWIFRVYCQKWKNLYDTPTSKYINRGQSGIWYLLIFPSTWGIKKIRKNSLYAWGLRSLKNRLFNFDIITLDLKDMRRNKKKLEFLGEITSNLSKKI